MREEIIERIYAQVLGGGITDLTGDALVELSGVSKRTFYKYIGTLDVLFNELMKRIMTRVENHFHKHRNRTDAEPLAIVRDTFLTLPECVTVPVRNFILQLHRVRPDLANKLFLFRRKQLKSIDSILIKAQSKKQVRADIHPKIATDALIAMVDSLLVPDYVLESGENFNTVFNTVFDIFFYGITFKRP